MSEPIPCAGPATDASRPTVADASVGIASGTQCVLGLLSLAAWLAWPMRGGITSPPWVKVALSPDVQGPVYVVLSATAFLGSRRLATRWRPTLYRAYLLGLAATLAATLSVSTMGRPTRDLGSNYLFFWTVYTLIWNPTVLVLTVRRCRRANRRARLLKSPLDLPGVKANLTLDQIVSAIHEGRDRPRSPLDVGFITLDRPITTDEIVSLIREGRERG